MKAESCVMACRVEGGPIPVNLWAGTIRGGGAPFESSAAAFRGGVPSPLLGRSTVLAEETGDGAVRPV